MNFREYVLETFDSRASLTSGRLETLERILKEYNATKYTKQQFYEEFGLEGIEFFEMIDFLVDIRNKERIVEFGNKFNTEEEQKSLI